MDYNKIKYKAYNATNITEYVRVDIQSVSDLRRFIIHRDPPIILFARALRARTIENVNSINNRKQARVTWRWLVLWKQVRSI